MMVFCSGYSFKRNIPAWTAWIEHEIQADSCVGFRLIIATLHPSTSAFIFLTEYVAV